MDVLTPTPQIDINTILVTGDYIDFNHDISITGIGEESVYQDDFTIDHENSDYRNENFKKPCHLDSFYSNLNQQQQKQQHRRRSLNYNPAISKLNQTNEALEKKLVFLAIIS